MPDKIAPLLKKLYSLQRRGIKPGLERISALAAHCGNPHNKFPAVHVAGTNGKGSVCSILASIYTEAGYSTGLYTSPHLISFNERIRVNGRKISESEIIDISEQLMPAADKTGATFFEITTALAFKYFELKKVDVAIIETGLGGRFDSTNILAPELSIITSIGLEHKEYLGSTLEEIAYEKAGIIKKGAPCLCAESNDKLKHVFQKKADSENAPLQFITLMGRDSISINNSEIAGSLQAGGKQYSNLPFGANGATRPQNAKICLAAASALEGKFPLKEEHIIAGFRNISQNTGFRSRFEMARKSPPLILDAAHNEDSINSLAENLKLINSYEKKWVVVFALMKDKNLEKILKTIEPFCKKLVAVQPETERAIPPEDICNAALGLGFKDVESYDYSLAGAAAAIKSGEPVIIAGSFFLIGEIIEYADKKISGRNIK